MKTRSGFVSNSSSSSFIVAYKIDDICPTCGRGKEDVGEIFEKYSGDRDDYCCDSTCCIARGGIEIVEKYLAQWGNDSYISVIDFEKEEREKLLADAKKAMEEGFIYFMMGDVSYHDEIGQALLQRPTVKILRYDG